MKTTTLLIISLITVSCSSKPFKEGRACPEIDLTKSTRKEGAYCLGRIYFKETNEDLPKIDTLAFKDIRPGDPAIPFIWLTVTSGLMSPESYNTFGVSPMTQDEWDEAIKKVRKKIEENRKKRSLTSLDE